MNLPPAGNDRVSRDAWIISVVSALVGLTALGFARFGYALLLPLMREGLGLSYAQAGWISGANLCGFLGGALLGGMLAGWFGARPVVGTALVLAALGAGLTAVSQAPMAVVGWQFLVGFGAGGAIVPAQNLPVVWFPPPRRGFASGIPSAGIGVGLVVVGMAFPALLPLTIRGLTGWRLAWAAIGGALLAVSVLSFWLLRESPAARRETGRVRDVFRIPGVWRLCGVYIFFGYSYLSYVAFFGAAVAGQRHWAPAAIGGAWAIGGMLSISSGLIWGALSDRIGRRRAVSLVFGVMALAYLTMALVPWDFAVYASAALWGIAAWAIPSLAVAVADDYVGARMLHPVMAIVNVVGAVGQMSGPVVTGYTVDLTGSFVPGLVLAAVVALAGGATALTLAERSGDGLTAARTRGR
ncbi:MAG: MFS transporter [candidate division NC10 bacterium]